MDIFDKTVKPILLYGCETWGFGKNDIIERVHLKFCKLLLHVKTVASQIADSQFAESQIAESN